MSTEQQHIGPSSIVTKAGVGVDGPGYLAGEYPAGRTTVNGVPVAASVDVFYELDTGDWQRVASAKSLPDGTWNIVGLDPDKPFHVLARHPGFGGVIATDVFPSRTDVITLSGDLTSNEEFNGVEGFMTIESGLPPFTAAVLQPLPSGLVPVIDGRKLSIDGASEDAGVWASVLRVTAGNGVWVDVPLALEIKNTAPRFWRIKMTADTWLNAGYRVVQIAELQFNGQQAIGGTPMASSSEEGDPAFGLAKAFDGNKSGNTVWGSTNTGSTVGQWLGYEFSSGIAVESVSITVRNHSTIASAWSPKSFDVESSIDGVSWKTQWSVAGQGAWGAAETRTFYRP